MIFPDPRCTDSTGLLCVGGELSVETLWDAYTKGVFPWPQEGLPLLWFSPPQRGVLDFSEVHVSRSLKKAMRKQKCHFTLNRAFDQVVHECAEVPRPHQDGTWILPNMVEAYLEFHRAGFAHSIECWDGEELVGGLYGVLVWNVFSGESMFFKRENASKFCLLELIRRLSLLGLTWMDIQMVTPVLETMGGHYIARDDFLARIEAAHQTREKTFAED